MENLEKLVELVKTLPENVAEAAGALVEQMGTVVEGIGDEPIRYRPETVKLVQGTSDRTKLPKGAGIGSMIIGENILENPTNVIPLRSWVTRQMWDPNPENSRMLCSSQDGEVGYAHGNCRTCQYSKFDEAENRSACNKSITVLFILADLSALSFINFSKTNYSNGTDWVSLMKRASVAPYKRIYGLNAETSSKSKNVEIIKISSEGKVAEELIPFLEELYKQVSEDRKASLQRYYEYIETRKNSAPELSAPSEEGTLLIAAEEEIPSTVEVQEADPSQAPVKRYKL